MTQPTWTQPVETDLTITKRFTFEAAHQLPWHKGKCARLHGHSYVLEVSVRGPVVPDDLASPESGMVMDFDRIKAALKPLIDGKLDHFSLNQIMRNPTAENIVLWLTDQLRDTFPGLCRLRLYETATSWVEWERQP